MLEPNFARNQVLKMNFMFNLLFQHFNGFVQEVHEVVRGPPDTLEQVIKNARKAELT